ncbi:hypothetical protein LINPERPRIM_LOCUS6620 [Linum perenne]
MEQRRR